MSPSRALDRILSTLMMGAAVAAVQALDRKAPRQALDRLGAR